MKTDSGNSGHGRSDSVEDSTRPKISRHIIALRDQLGLLKEEKSVTSSTHDVTDIVDNKPNVVVYHAPKKRKVLPTQCSPESPTVVEAPEFNINKAKHDVRKLTIGALGKKNKAEAQAALAISLGAIPPKRKAVNYKELKMERLKEKKAAAQRAETEVVFAGRIKQMTAKKSRKNPNKVIKFDSGFGKPGKLMRMSKNNKV